MYLKKNVTKFEPRVYLQVHENSSSFLEALHAPHIDEISDILQNGLEVICKDVMCGNLTHTSGFDVCE
jgi:hypothetical protein